MYSVLYKSCQEGTSSSILNAREDIQEKRGKVLINSSSRDTGLTLIDSECTLSNMTKVTGRQARVTAQERREDILAAAMSEFSEKGFHGASTVTIAERAEISHPNLFRLFPTKKSLFIATLERLLERLNQSMIAAGRNNPDNPLGVMEARYHALLDDNELILLMLQGYAASNDEEIRATMRHVAFEIFTQVEDMPGVNTERARHFYAEGMLLAIAAALRLPEIAADETWARRFLGDYCSD